MIVTLFLVSGIIDVEHERGASHLCWWWGVWSSSPTPFSREHSELNVWNARQWFSSARLWYGLAQLAPRPFARFFLFWFSLLLFLLFFSPTRPSSPFIFKVTCSVMALSYWNTAPSCDAVKSSRALAQIAIGWRWWKETRPLQSGNKSSFARVQSRIHVCCIFTYIDISIAWCACIGYTANKKNHSALLFLLLKFNK